METEADIKFYTVQEIADIMGIGKSLAYKFVTSDKCPFTVLKLGKRYCIPKNSFYQWYDELANPKSSK